MSESSSNAGEAAPRAGELPPPHTIMPERAVVIVAHPDDIEFGCSGTVACWTDAGASVTYVIVTDGAAGSNQPGVLRRDLVTTREREQRESAAAVGVTDVRFLGHPDGELTPSLALRRELTQIIREVRPNVVITMDPTMIFSANRGYVNHPDHRAAGEAAMYATFPSAGSRPIFKDLLVEGYEPHNVDMLWLMLTNDPSHRVDISAGVERKRAALACHASQIGQQQIDMVLGWNKEAGQEAGVAYAESFRIIDFRRAPPAETDPETSGG